MEKSNQENINKEEIEDSQENIEKIETPKNEIGDNLNIDQILVEREFSDSLLDKLKEIQFDRIEVKEQIADAKSVEVSIEIENNNLSFSDIEKLISSYEEDIEEFKVVNEEIIDNIIPLKLKIIEDLSMESDTDIYKLEEIIEPLSILKRNINKIIDLEGKLIFLKKQSEEKYCEEHDFSSKEDILKIKEDLYKELMELKTGSFFEKIKNRNEIRNLQNRISEIRKIIDGAPHYYSISDPSSVRVYSLEILSNDITEIILNKTLIRLDNQSGIDFNKKNERLDRNDIEELDEETLDSLFDDYIEKVIMIEIRKEEEGSGIKFSKKQIDRSKEILKKSFPISFFWRIGGDKDSQRKEETIRDIQEEIDDIDPNELKWIIDRYATSTKYGNNNTLSEYLSEVVFYSKKFISSDEDEYEFIEDQYKLLNSKAEALNIQYSEVKRSINNRISYFSSFKEHGYKKDLDNFISKIDMDVLSVLLENEEIQEIFDENDIEKINSIVYKNIFNQLMVSEQGTNDSRDIGQKMFRYKNPESIMFNICNSFRERGYRGDYPFISNDFDITSDKTVLYKYLISLNEEEIEKLKDLNVEEINRILELIFENKENFSKPNIGSDTGDCINNPVFKEIKNNLLSLSSKFIKGEDENLKTFGISMLDVDYHGIASCLDTVKEIIIKKASSKEDMDLKSNIFKKIFKNFNSLNIDKLIKRPYEELHDYLYAFIKIDKSPSQEIQRIKNELIEQILESDNPEESLKYIEDIFIKNNLPMIGKIYLVFERLHDKDSLDDKINRSGGFSEYLRKSGNRRRLFTLYNDLLKVHIESGNRSLRDYLLIIKDGEEAMEYINEKGIENLEIEELKKVEFFIAKLRTLFNNSQTGRVTGEKEVKQFNKEEIIDEYQKMLKDLKVKEGQSISNRIVDMFIKPVGYSSVEEILNSMEEYKDISHKRGVEMFENSKDGHLELEEGDLLKGVDLEYFDNILQNGNVAKEFLGASSDSDVTPLDADVAKILSKNMKGSFFETIKSSMAFGFFNGLMFVIKDRGQFQETDEDTKEFDKDKMELFNTGTSEHYGIRTGFPMTEVDYIIVKDNVINDNKIFEKIIFEIVKNGYYIPLVDEKGEIIFTPDMFDEYYKSFNGLSEFNNSSLEIIEIKEEDRSYNRIQEIKDTAKENKKNIEKISKKIKKIIFSVLGEYDIELKSKHDTELFGAELHDTGSTGRHTNAPEDYDFDLALRLDSVNLEHRDNILNKLKEVLKPEGTESSENLLRAFSCKCIEGEAIDIDISIVGKSKLTVFASHDAVGDKLDWISNNLGEDIYEGVAANIILTKEVLKEGGVYKKVEGGIGGIGVENWLLLYGGNMLEAFQSFYDAAHDNDNNRISFDEFRLVYKILDPGINIRDDKHDNYIDKLNSGTYNKMLDVIEEYLK